MPPKLAPSQPTSGSGKCNELPSGVRGGSPTENTFWRTLKATERSLLHLYADALSSSNNVICHIWGKTRPRFGGNCPLCANVEPRCFTQWLTAPRSKSAPRGSIITIVFANYELPVEIWPIQPWSYYVFCARSLSENTDLFLINISSNLLTLLLLFDYIHVRKTLFLSGLYIYTVSGKKEATLFSTTTLAFFGRFLYFLYRWKQEWILDNYM